MCHPVDNLTLTSNRLISKEISPVAITSLVLAACDDVGGALVTPLLKQPPQRGRRRLRGRAQSLRRMRGAVAVAVVVALLEVGRGELYPRCGRRIFGRGGGARDDRGGAVADAAEAVGEAFLLGDDLHSVLYVCDRL